jgi:hypothetical protein
MRDPHVVALHYRLEAGPQLAFRDPQPVKRERDSFSLELYNNQLRVQMTDHFATAEEAHREVEPYLRAWEIATGLRHGPAAIRFTFAHSEIIDRDPPPPGASVAVQLQNVECVATAEVAWVVVTSGKYPDPPDTFIASSDVVTMWERYEGYWAGKEPLSSLAYYCATATQYTRARWTISPRVFQHLRYLSTMVGTPQTLRKRTAHQVLREHTLTERAWMEAAVKRIIQRVGEYAADPRARWPQITMEDFPKL